MHATSHHTQSSHNLYALVPKVRCAALPPKPERSTSKLMLHWWLFVAGLLSPSLWDCLILCPSGLMALH